jgi:hypothetical protein
LNGSSRAGSVATTGGGVGTADAFADADGVAERVERDVGRADVTAAGASLPVMRRK